MNKEQRLLAKILKQCGLKFRLKSPDEEGWLFLHRKRRKEEVY